jgi:hypothetical protein
LLILDIGEANLCFQFWQTHELSITDTEHLLWKEIKSLVFLMREVDTSLIDDDSIDQMLKDLDSINLRLMKFRKTEASKAG